MGIYYINLKVLYIVDVFIFKIEYALLSKLGLVELISNRIQEIQQSELNLNLDELHMAVNKTQKPVPQPAHIEDGESDEESDGLNDLLLPTVLPIRASCSLGSRSSPPTKNSIGSGVSSRISPSVSFSVQLSPTTHCSVIFIGQLSHEPGASPLAHCTNATRS